MLKISILLLLAFNTFLNANNNLSSIETVEHPLLFLFENTSLITIFSILFVIRLFIVFINKLLLSGSSSSSSSFTNKGLSKSSFDSDDSCD